MITQKDIKSNFKYKNGTLIWIRRAGGVQIGDVAGTKNLRGYYQTSINGKIILIHRAIFLYHHGYLPEFLDHADGDKTNNRIENIRKATKSQNQMNIGLISTNTSGIKGVHWCSYRSRWVCQIVANGKHINLGRYKEKSKAIDIIRSARVKLHGEFANHG